MSNPEKVTISCYGGCEQKLPPLLAGKVRRVDMNASASFWGYTDEWPDAETAASVIRARDILAAGITHLAIEKAKRCN